MGKSRLSMRREVEAAEAAEAESGKKKTTRPAGEKKEGTAKKRATKGEKDPAAPKKRKAAKPRTKRAKEAMQRRRLIWVVYSSTMREEGRFLYHERDKADELLATLLGRGKRRYFMQPMKEALNPDGTPVAQSGTPVPDEDLDDEVKVEVDVEAADEIDIDADIEGDEEEEEVVEEEVADDAVSDA